MHVIFIIVTEWFLVTMAGLKLLDQHTCSSGVFFYFRLQICVTGILVNQSFFLSCDMNEYTLCIFWNYFVFGFVTAFCLCLIDYINVLYVIQWFVFRVMVLGQLGKTSVIVIVTW